jgi:hypothetical protein
MRSDMASVSLSLRNAAWLHAATMRLRPRPRPIPLIARECQKYDIIVFSPLIALSARNIIVLYCILFNRIPRGIKMHSETGLVFVVFSFHIVNSFVYEYIFIEVVF